MKTVKRIIPLIASFNALSEAINEVNNNNNNDNNGRYNRNQRQNDRKVNKFRQKLEKVEDYDDLQNMFDQNLHNFDKFEKELQSLGLNIELDPNPNDLNWNPGDHYIDDQKPKLIDKVPPPPPKKNSTDFIKYATEELKKKVSFEQKLQVEEIQTKIINHQEVSKTDKLKLLMFEEIAINFEDPEDNIFEKTNQNFAKNSKQLHYSQTEEILITGRSMISSGEKSNDLTRGLDNSNEGSALNQISYYLDSIWNYGCWCYFGDNMNHGRGIPVNKVDHTCRALNYCYSCVRIDERDKQNSCAPGSVSYNRPTSLSNEKHSWEISCEVNNNGDDCKINTCKCETQFVKSLIQLFFDGYRFQPEFKHDLGIFNPNVCGPSPVIRGIDNDDDDDDNNEDYGYIQNNNNHVKRPQGERKCCGQFPDRKPYNSAFQGCCTKDLVGHVFNMEERMCCKDGTIKMVCPDYVDGYDDLDDN